MVSRSWASSSGWPPSRRVPSTAARRTWRAVTSCPSGLDARAKASTRNRVTSSARRRSRTASVRSLATRTDWPHQPRDETEKDHADPGCGENRRSIAAHELRDPIEDGRRARGDDAAREVAVEVVGESGRRGIAIGGVGLEGAQEDVVEVSLQRSGEALRGARTTLGDPAQRPRLAGGAGDPWRQREQPAWGSWPGGLEGLLDLAQGPGTQIERPPAGEHLVQDHPE